MVVTVLHNCFSGELRHLSNLLTLVNSPTLPFIMPGCHEMQEELLQKAASTAAAETDANLCVALVQLAAEAIAMIGNNGTRGWCSEGVWCVPEEQLQKAVVNAAAAETDANFCEALVQLTAVGQWLVLKGSWCVLAGGATGGSSGQRCR